MPLQLALFLHRRFLLIKKKDGAFLTFLHISLVINNYKSQEERVRSLEANDEE